MFILNYIIVLYIYIFCSVENTPFRNPQRMNMIDVLANQLHYNANHSTVNEPNVELFNDINVLSD